MKAKASHILGCLIVIALTAVALAEDKPIQRKQSQPGPAKAERATSTVVKAAPEFDFPVIGYLEKRRQTITIKAGPKGPVYSAKTTAGKTLFENLSADQLRAQAPEIHQFIKTAVTGASGKSGVVIDASVR